VSDQWVLFGFDLTRLERYLRLAVNQLLWGSEAGIRRRFSPLIATVALPDTDKTEFSEFGLVERDKSPGDSLALIIPNEITLYRSLHLPAVSELELASVIQLEVSSSSPFPEGDTVFGWRITSRAEDYIEISIAITSRAAIAHHLSTRADLQMVSQASLEIWSCENGRLTQIQGFAEDARREACLKALAQRAFGLVALLVGFMLLLSLPTMTIQLRATQLEDLAGVTQITAGAATEAKNHLVQVEDRLIGASQFFSERIFYHEWLNTLAQLTPDSVYLTRLSLDGSRLTITGLANNAAEYQTLLAEADLVSDLSAPSAFTRDGRAGKERFTLTMRIGGGDK
jgi:general secretion pathway protein L